MYKLIKIKDEYYLVSNKEPMDRHLCMAFHKETKAPMIDDYYQGDAHYYVYKPMSIVAVTKRISGLTTLPLLDKNQIEILLGTVDVKGLASKWALDNADKTMETNSSLNKGFIGGYNKCLQDNADKKFTLEDMRKCFEASRETVPHPDWDKIYDTFEEYINSLKEKTEWEVEIELHSEVDALVLYEDRGKPIVNEQGYINILNIK